MEAGERVLVFLIGEGRIRHSGELLVEDVLMGLQRRIQKLMERTVVSEGQGEESRLDLVGYRAGLVELRDVEEIARMLPVQRCAELPAVKFRAGKDVSLTPIEGGEKSRCRQLDGFRKFAFKPSGENDSTVCVDGGACFVRRDKMQEPALCQCASPSKSNGFLELKMKG